MNIFVRLLMGSAAVFSIGCAKENLMETRQRTQAPKNAADVGVVLEDASAGEVTQLLARNPASQVRVLNKEHGMYEIFGVTQDVAQAGTQGRATNNVYFQLESQQRIQPFAVGDPDETQIGNLNPCIQSNNGGPQAKIDILQPAELADSIIEMGTTIKISGANSTAGSEASGNNIGRALASLGQTQARLQANRGPASLKSAIVIVAPDSSLTPKAVINGTEAEVTPDAMGFYQIFLVVQDSSDRCSIDGVRFLVTANRPYKGPNSPALKVDLKRLSQIDAVSAKEAWALSEGEGITIAVVDTGVNYNHPTLAPNIKINENEIADNKIDDDGNGFVDDVIGYDFVSDDAFPYDDVGHGTHVSGLAASRDFGIARKAKILPVKALTAVGGDIASIAAAVKYAVDRGANIINMSLGTAAPKAHPAMVAAANYAESKGVLMVVAVGNGDPQTGLGVDIDQSPVFPASLPNDNIVTVASFDSKDVLSSYSNFGKTGVDVVAPGGGEKDMLISAAFENPHKALWIGMSGTSMASPVVAGIAADVMALNPHLTVAQVKDILIHAGPDVPELAPVTVSGRHIDALSALKLAK